MIMTIVALVAALVGFLACAIPEWSLTWYSYVEATEGLAKTETSITYHHLAEQRKSQTNIKKAMPSQGDVSLLCIPIEFTDYEFTDSILADLATLFNGAREETGYWESISSYYRKSSFGKLNINVEISSIYKTGVTAASFASSLKDVSRPENVTNPLLLRSVQSLSSSLDLSKFDSDSNGYFDGIYLIYSCPDFSEAAKSEGSYYNQSPSLQTSFESLFWAFTGWNPTSSSLSVKPNSYVWASYDFMYKAVASPAVDAHTYIHETGHLLGLADYYNSVSVEDESKYGKFAHYLPCGGLQMMDHNIGDFDAWTKFALGWNSAYIVDKEKGFPQTFELDDSTLAGDLLLIPASDGSYSGNAFGEYIAIELYTPNGLNELDSKKTNLSGYGYLGGYPTMYDLAGVRMSHIDSRLAMGGNYREPTVEDLANVSGDNYYQVAAHNLLTEVSSPDSEKVYWLNQILESSGDLTLVTETSFANNDTLFRGNEKKGNFSMEKFPSYFVEKDEDGSPLFNSGAEFGYTIRVNGTRTKNGVLSCSITVSLEA